MSSRWNLCAGALAVAAGLAVACSSDEAPQPSGSPMAPRATTPTAGGENLPPVIETVRIEPGSPVPGDKVRARVRASDPDRDSIELAYVWSTGGGRLLGGGPEIVLPELRKGAGIEVAVTASDGRATSPPFEATARIANRLPELVELRIDVSGSEVTASPEARDPDGDRLSFEYAWFVNGKQVRRGGDGARFSIAGLKRGDELQVRAMARDGEDTSSIHHSDIVRIENSPPEILSSAPAPGANGVFRYAVKARDPDGDRNLRYRLRKSPEGMRVDEILGEIVWIPSVDQAGRHPVEVAVKDPHGGTTIQAFVLTVVVEEEASEPSQSPAGAR